MMVAAPVPEGQRVAFTRDVLQRPDLAIKLGGLLQVVDRELNAAQAVDSGFAHGFRLLAGSLPGISSVSGFVASQISAKIDPWQPPRGDPCIPPLAAALVAFATGT